MCILLLFRIHYFPLHFLTVFKKHALIYSYVSPERTDLRTAGYSSVVEHVPGLSEVYGSAHSTTKHNLKEDCIQTCSGAWYSVQTFIPSQEDQRAICL